VANSTSSRPHGFTGMMTVYRWDRSAGWAAADRLPDSAVEVAADQVVWVDLSDPTPEEEEAVFGRFLKVHPLTLEDVTKSRRDPGPPHPAPGRGRARPGLHLPPAPRRHGGRVRPGGGPSGDPAGPDGSAGVPRPVPEGTGHDAPVEADGGRAAEDAGAGAGGA